MEIINKPLNFSDIKYKVISGIEESDIINSFYAEDNRSSRARDIDTFLVAFFNNIIVGSIRLCVEENLFLLRSMLIHSQYRGKGLGRRLLLEFEKQLLSNLRRPVYCVPHDYLETFYSSINFRARTTEEVPLFLANRIEKYKSNGHNCILMIRDGAVL